MANLYNKNIGINYKGILNLDSTINTPLDTTLRSVTDGMGTASVLNLSTTQVNIGGGTALGRLTVRGDGTNPIAMFQNSAGVDRVSVNNVGALICSANNNEISSIRSNGTFSIYQPAILTANSLFDWGNGAATLAGVTGTLAGHSTILSLASSTGSANKNVYDIRYTINNSGVQTGTATGIFLNATETALNGMTHNLMDLQVGGVSAFQVTKNDTYVGIYGTNATKLYFNGTNGTRPYLGTAAFQLFLDMGSYNFTISRLGTNQITFSNNGNHILNLVAGSLTQFGGTTNAFPSIKRNGTAIDFRLADDSAFCDINAATIKANTNLEVLQSSLFGGVVWSRGVTDLRLGTSGFGTGMTLASATADVTITTSLTLNSTTKGFLMPRMTYAQMKAISSPATGLQVYNTTDNTPQVYDGTGYQILGTSVVTGTISAGATTLSCDNGNVFNLTLVNGTPTAITLSNARPTSVIINLKQPAGGSALVTWSTTIVWAGGSPPTLTTTANFLDVITLIYDGTTWRGTATLNFAS